MRRRNFIRTAAAAGLLTQLPAVGFSRNRTQSQKKPGGTFSDRIVAIGDQERSSRVERARQLMTEAGIDALMLEGGTTMRYFTGVRWGRSERLFLMVLPARGEVFYLSPRFEESRAAEQVGSAPLYTWEEDESPYVLLSKVMRERGTGTGTIALEESTRYFGAEGIAKQLSSASIVNGTIVTAECRAVKSKAELNLMQVANEITAEVYRAALPGLKEGMTEKDLGQVISTGFSEYGVRGGALVLFGEASAHPHGLQKENTLKEGDIVLIDGGCSVSDYVSDVTRTTVFGTPTDRMKRIFDIVFRAQSAALQAARPGVPAESIDAAARKVIDDGGFGPGYRYFTHRLGHGIGMEGHEWFYLVRGNTRPEKAGETHSNEPGIYIPGEFGIRIEDDMVITEDGAHLMLPSPAGIDSIFG